MCYMFHELSIRSDDRSTTNTLNFSHFEDEVEEDKVSVETARTIPCEARTNTTSR
jgi:hypothetical protein